MASAMLSVGGDFIKGKAFRHDPHAYTPSFFLSSPNTGNPIPSLGKVNHHG
jgi:hypothetical protein